MGGGEVALFNLARSLDRDRYTPVVVLLQDGPLRQRLEEAGVETHVLPGEASVLDARKDSLGFASLLKLKQVLGAIVMAARLARKIRRLNVAIVHTNSLKADLIGGLAGRFCRKPVIWHVRDRIASDYLPRSVVWAFRAMANIIPTWVIANSAATLQTLARAGRSKGAVPSGIDLNREYAFEDSDSEEPRRGPRAGSRIVHDGTSPEEESAAPASVEELAAVSRPVALIGLVGRIARWKGQHVFIQAAAWTLRKFPDVRFKIIGAPLFGEDDYLVEIKQMVTRLNLENAVEFTGHQTDIPRIMASLDVLVHASITGEPFGQVIIEGMAAGKPVVATSGGGVPEIVVDQETGFLVPMGDATAMALAICDLLENPARRAGNGPLRPAAGASAIHHLPHRGKGDGGIRHAAEHSTVERGRSDRHGVVSHQGCPS